MVKVKDPGSGIFVPNKLIQSFDPSQYYAKQSHFDAGCGTSEVHIDSFRTQNSSSYMFKGERVSRVQGIFLSKYELPLREGRQSPVLKLHGSH